MHIKTCPKEMPVDKPGGSGTNNLRVGRRSDFYDARFLVLHAALTWYIVKGKTSFASIESEGVRGLLLEAVPE